ncbi:MAG: transglutaminase family protein [Planctomycetota bacterium]
MNNPARRLRVRHTTTYRYDRPVQRSAHLLHLRPLTDNRQCLLDFDLHITPAAEVMAFDDVFGNACHAFDIDTPYTELTVTARSTVELTPRDPFAFAASHTYRPEIPLLWQPRERQMLDGYLRSVELPDNQIDDLFQYAKSFVSANNGDLLETLFHLNLELFNNYEYVPGSTSNTTTPFEVMQSKRGVCQDFAQLFVCLARLLGIPARYACGYIFTGNTGVERAQSDASHAWVELYLPKVGWRGFDPTNGCLPDAGHVRVSYGRFYRDATPTGGTLYGNAVQTALDIDVTVEEVDAQSSSTAA